MTAKPQACEYMVVRYAPDPVKAEFVNIGVLLLESGSTSGYAGVRFTRDWRRVRCLDPDADLEMLGQLEGGLRAQLQLQDRQEFLRFAQESLSGPLELTAPNAVLAEEPEAELARLAEMYLETARRDARREVSGRTVIHAAMRGAFEQAGVWGNMRKRIAAAQYTRPGDPLRIDCAYRPN